MKTTDTVLALATSVSAQFKLDNEQQDTVLALLEHDPLRRKRYSDLVQAAQISPALATQCRVSLLDDLKIAPPEVERTPQTAQPEPPVKATRKRATKLKSDTLPAAPVATTLPAAPAVRVPIGVCYAPFIETHHYLPGKTELVAGCKVCYVAAEGWVDWQPATQPTNVVVQPPRETSITVDDRDIPVSHNNAKYKLPWVMSASYWEKGDAYYVKFGTGHRTVSVRLDELKATLHQADELLKQIAAIEARLG